MDIDNNPRAHCNPVSGDSSHHMDRPGHRGRKAGISSFSFSPAPEPCYIKQRPRLRQQGDCGGSSCITGFVVATRTRKSGRGTGHWKLNLQILVPYRKTFLQPNSENSHLTSFNEYLICMG